ncbi:MAG: ComF family protein [Candidatus Limnocylindria bacterium]
MALLDVVLPPSCGGCGRFGALLCPACRATFRPPVPAVDRFFAADAGVVIGDAVEVAVSAFAYEGALRRALQRLKYGRVARLARPLAETAAPAFASIRSRAEPAPTAVPIPLHPLRERQRGYNQAALLAVELGRIARIPVRDVLVRRRLTTKQHTLDRAARIRNLAGAFVARPGTAVPASVVLIDDILTTSATLESCAAVLRAAGVGRVYGFTIAREV